MIPLPFRQVHLDFHTSPEMLNVGSLFDPEEFARTLESAGVQSVTCFSRCHHGYLYYDSPTFGHLVHPNLARPNLLAAQIEACHARGIRTPVYTTVQFDHLTATRHPEWLALTPHGTPFGLRGDDEDHYRDVGPFNAGFYRRLCLNSPYTGYLKELVGDLYKAVPALDGLFLDIVWPTPCCCPRCQAGMREQGLEPRSRKDRLEFNLRIIERFTKEMTDWVRSFHPEASIYYNNGAVSPGNRRSLPAMTHLEFDNLPGARPSGYAHAQSTALFDRTLGLPYIGQTGKFHTDWGDVGSYKNREALRYECLKTLALGGRCMVGDQLPPSGRIDRWTYDLIGAVFREIDSKEPWCVGASPLVEVGLWGETSAGNESLLGAMNLLQEAAWQFDLIDSESDWGRYGTIVFPDSCEFSPRLEAKVRSYLAAGGRIIASFEAGMDRSRDGFVLREWGVEVSDPGPLDPNGFRARGRIFETSDYADYLLPRAELEGSLPPVPHVMYQSGLPVRALPGAAVWADRIPSVFDRTAEHFFSHRQAPASDPVIQSPPRPGTPAVVVQDQVLYFAHPIFDLYAQFAPLWVKTLFRDAAKKFLPPPLVLHHGPSGTEVFLTRQEEERRTILHVLYFVKKPTRHLEVIEDVVPLQDWEVSVHCEVASRVVLVPQGEGLPFHREGSRIAFVVPRILGHQMVALEDLAY